MKMNRKQLRLTQYDYGTPGIYFVTICAIRKQCYFGKIRDAVLIPSVIGHIVRQVVEGHIDKYEGIHIMEYVIMPNHIHLLVDISIYQGTMKIGKFVNAIKGHVTRQCHHSIWQRGFYERVIRNDIELRNCQEYIRHNPLKWELDSEYVSPV